jgi:hypothetical protein
LGHLGPRAFPDRACFAEREKAGLGRTGKKPTAQEKAISALLEAVAERKGSSVTSVALAYCLAKGPYVFPVVGGRKVEQLKGNIEALSLRLSQDDIRENETGYSFDPGFPHTFIGGSLFSNKEPKGSYAPEDIWLIKFQGTFDWVEGNKAIQRAEV